MDTPLRVLLVEDCEEDALLVERELRRGGLAPECFRVDTAEAMRQTLGGAKWDVIIADYSMPHFSGLAAFQMYKDAGLDVPFIIVSGTIGEDVAVAVMKVGVHDYVMKGNLTRLVPAIQRELAERLVRRKAEEQVISQNAVLGAIDEIYRRKQEGNTLEDLGKVCLNVCEKLTNSKFGFIGQLNDDGLFDIIAISNSGRDACRIPGKDAAIAVYNMPVRGIDRSTLKDGKSRIVNELSDHPDRVGFPDGHPDVSSFLGVPLTEQNRTIGMIGLGNKDGGYTTADQITVESVALAIVEVLKRKRAELALRDIEKRFRTMVAESPIGISMYDATGQCVMANNAIAQHVGTNVEQILQQNYNQVESWRVSGLLKHAQTTVTNGEPARCEISTTSASGKHINLDCHFVPLQSGELLFMADDVSELKHLQEALAESEAKYRTLIASAPSAILTMDTNGLITLSNSRTETLFGYDSEELMGLPIETLIPQLNWKINENASGREPVAHPKEPSVSESKELVGKRKDGGAFPIEVSLNYFCGADKQTMTICLAHDITDRKQSESTLQRFNTQLKHSNAELDEFAYIASHDLKEPLRGIHNYSAFLIDDYHDKLDEDGRSKLQTIKDLSQRMERLIDSLLYFSRLGRSELAYQPTDLNKVLRDVLASLKINIEETEVEIRVPEPLPTISCNHVRVVELYRNLITNALKYNDKTSKWIEIGVQVDPNFGQTLYVRDNGIGIDKKHFDSIFKIFKRLHGRDKFGDGTGVGLTFAKKIVERHGGHIWVESEPGVGTTFHFTLQGGQNYVDLHKNCKTAASYSVG